MSDPEVNALTIRIVESIARVEAKVDQLMALDGVKNLRLSEQDARIGKLEHGRSWLLGACAVVAAVSSFLIKALFV